MKRPSRRRQWNRSITSVRGRNESDVGTRRNRTLRESGRSGWKRYLTRAPLHTIFAKPKASREQQKEAVKFLTEKVAEMFKATSDLGDWDGAAKLEPEVSIEATDDPTTMRFKVTPGDGTAARAFLQIRK